MQRINEYFDFLKQFIKLQNYKLTWSGRKKKYSVIFAFLSHLL